MMRGNQQGSTVTSKYIGKVVWQDILHRQYRRGANGVDILVPTGLNGRCGALDVGNDNVPVGGDSVIEFMIRQA